MPEPKNPMQPLYLDKHATIRFKANKIVDDLLNFASIYGLDLNRIAGMDYTQDDREQFHQLIGYSVSGFGELPGMSSESVAEADALAVRLLKSLGDKPDA
jgi:hypothetical protein